ncbi:spore germination protein [Neobacillus sp. MER 74]|jgi:spore germination protein PA|uniref:spore germination protein n=1 Tax=Bacillaceae TaxID=186817 RepID=UPI000BF305A8|nr:MULTISPECIES: spore germination protein [Bacillaceae]MCM3114330.1 spore germination protein [Neobacillus sp. MER 74]PFP29622.1 spore gernimation protein GerPA [Bacillus sp. AFS073361]
MPAIVGVAQVITLGSSSVFHIGDVYKIMPFSTAKTFSGAGSFNTGESLQLQNNVSSTNTSDSDVYDQGIALNA